MTHAPIAATGGPPRFRRLQWLFPILVTLHNGEEAIAFPAWSQRAASWYPHTTPAEVRFGAVVFALFAFVVTYFSFRSGKQSTGAYLTFGYMVAMVANAFLPHVVASLWLRSYTPGVITAVLLNIPMLTFLAWLAGKEGFVSGRKAWTYAVLVPLVLLALIRPVIWLARLSGL